MFCTCLLVAMVTFNSSLCAEPMWIEFGELMQRAETIVVARYDGPVDTELSQWENKEHHIHVERVLKGNGTPGSWKVRRADSGAPDIQKGTRCVVFLDSEMRFEWVAVPSPSHELDSGPLVLRGFYDFNAYLVSVSLISLSQLEGYLETGELKYNFSGSLHFFSPETRRPEPTDIEINLSYDHQKKTEIGTLVRGKRKLAIKSYHYDRDSAIVMEFSAYGKCALTLELDARPPDLVVLGNIGDSNELAQELLLGPIQCHAEFQGCEASVERTPCTLELEGIRFAPR